MTKEQMFKITLDGGAIKINNLEITAEVAAKVIRILMPVTNGLPGSNNQEDSLEYPSRDQELGGGHVTIKQFMVQKQPKSDMERIACLAFYLTHNKQITSFKTIDLTHLNIEAAQPKITNPSASARNAVSQQYLASAGGGKKQITPRGEALVNALPNRSEVNKALKSIPLRGNKRSTGKKKK